MQLQWAQEMALQHHIYQCIFDFSHSMGVYHVVLENYSS